VIAAVNVGAPAFRTQKSDVDRFIVLLKEASSKISARLGW
jgi:DNA-binding IclR family transcriptional regulator